MVFKLITEISLFDSEIPRLVLSTDNETELLESVSPEPEVRVLREVDEDFACYTLTVISKRTQVSRE